MFIVIVLIVLLVILLIFNDTPSDTISGDKNKKFSSTRFKAAATDGDNTVLVSSSDGEVKKASNNATIDAVNTKLTGVLTVDKICSSAGACIVLGEGISLKTKDNNELRITNDQWKDIAHYNNNTALWASTWARNPDSELNKNYLRKNARVSIYQPAIGGGNRYITGQGDGGNTPATFLASKGWLGQTDWILEA